MLGMLLRLCCQASGGLLPSGYPHSHGAEWLLWKLSFLPNRPISYSHEGHAELLYFHRCRNPHEARETYKTLKDQNIGGAAESADLYCQWANLEIKAGLSSPCISARTPYSSSLAVKSSRSASRHS